MSCTIFTHSRQELQVSRAFRQLAGVEESTFWEEHYAREVFVHYGFKRTIVVSIESLLRCIEPKSLSDTRVQGFIKPVKRPAAMWHLVDWHTAMSTRNGLLMPTIR